jgi:hypothetical protein
MVLLDYAKVLSVRRGSAQLVGDPYINARYFLVGADVEESKHGWLPNNFPVHDIKRLVRPSFLMSWASHFFGVRLDTSSSFPETTLKQHAERILWCPDDVLETTRSNSKPS